MTTVQFNEIFLLHRWQRVTLPLPYYALTPSTRFRFAQDGDSNTAWALDDGEDGWMVCCFFFFLNVKSILYSV
jgi:hypothetical protein